MEMKRQRDWLDREHQQWDRGVTRGYASAWKAYGKGWGKHGREERRSRSRESNASWRVETLATTAAIAWKRPRRAETARDFTREITMEHSRNRSTSNQVRTPSASQSEEDRAQAAKKLSKKNAKHLGLYNAARRACGPFCDTSRHANGVKAQRGDTRTMTNRRLPAKNELREKPGPVTRTNRKPNPGSADQHAGAASGRGEAKMPKPRQETAAKKKKKDQSIAAEHATRKDDANLAKPASPTSRATLKTLILAHDTPTQAEFWASVIAHVIKFVDHKLEPHPEILRMKEGEFRGMGIYKEWMRIPVAQAPAKAMLAFHGATWDALASIKNNVRPGKRQGGRRSKSWMNHAAAGEQKVAFASKLFCEALKYAGPIAVRSCTAVANLMIVLGVYQTADRWQTAGANGDSKHALQALQWPVSDVYLRAWVGTDAEDLVPSGFEQVGRFNWKGLHEYREITESQNRNYALRVKEDLANRIQSGQKPWDSQLFCANPLRTRQPPAMRE